MDPGRNKEWIALAGFIMAMDVDGTLCESCGIVSDSIKRALNSRPIKNITYVFISGGSRENIEHSLGEDFLRQSFWALPANGTMRVHYDDMGRTAHCYSRYFNSNEEDTIDCVLQEAILKFNLPSVQNQILFRGAQITLSCIGRYALAAAKAEFDPDGRRRNEIVEFIREKLADKLPHTNLYVGRGGTTSIDVGRLSKAQGLGVFLRTLGRVPSVHDETMVFIGNEPTGNDKDIDKIMPVRWVTPERSFEDIFWGWVGQRLVAADVTQSMC